MPEYLAPGVFVEEVSFRSKSIEGVPTRTTGFAGLAHYGPVQYPGGPHATEPRLVTSFTEFERVYGGLDRSRRAAPTARRTSRHAARAFFLNGGQRLYVSRVFMPHDATADLGVASANVSVPRRRRRPAPSGGPAGRAHGQTCAVTVERHPERRRRPSTPARRRAARQRRRPTASVLEVVPAGAPLPERRHADRPAEPAGAAASTRATTASRSSWPTAATARADA